MIQSPLQTIRWTIEQVSTKGWKRIEIIQSVFSECKGIKLQLNKTPARATPPCHGDTPTASANVSVILWYDQRDVNYSRKSEAQGGWWGGLLSLEKVQNRVNSECATLYRRNVLPVQGMKELSLSVQLQTARGHACWWGPWMGEPHWGAAGGNSHGQVLRLVVV